MPRTGHYSLCQSGSASSLPLPSAGEERLPSYFLFGCFIFAYQSRSVRFQILRLPAVKIAFFLVMFKQFLLFFSLLLHFPGCVFEILRQGIMVVAGSGALCGLAGTGVSERLQEG